MENSATRGAIESQQPTVARAIASLDIVDTAFYFMLPLPHTSNDYCTRD